MLSFKETDWLESTQGGITKVIEGKESYRTHILDASTF